MKIDSVFPKKKIYESKEKKTEELLMLFGVHTSYFLQQILFFFFIYFKLKQISNIEQRMLPGEKSN